MTFKLDPTPKQIYGTIMLLLYQLLPSQRVLKLIPIESLFIPLKETNREIYEIERRNYNLAFALQNRGDTLAKRDYKLYKHIAEKYGWRYIKELYDD